ncbi:SIR2 family protein [Hymenobacter sp. HDW8]|uniref:SIR2 family protein n=1 Tax=Hymenobacter sp. HDW8 TaxID=2714932 RepID=UPI00140D58C8|nr:SIR2 family protein [Hymenobacter sp. HDW8]QIL78303.1 hypothetical protein G7064_21010 [Hymenobacter sp. HDW8]
MQNHILEFEGEQLQQLHRLFAKMAEGNTILFLGAGASVTDESKYLGPQLIDLFEAKVQKDFGTRDLIEFVDILQQTQGVTRRDFDNIVDDVLRKIRITEAHKTLASVPWRNIITTNYDLLVEQAYDAIVGTLKEKYKLVPVRKHSAYNYHTAQNEVKYIKLNGCIQDKKEYPLVFSTDDFNKARRFYKLALSELKNMSDAIEFISIGYSYSDPFAKQLLKEFDKYNYKERRYLYSVDPYVNDSQLDFLKSNKIIVIKTSFSIFFKMYEEWVEQNSVHIAKALRVQYTDSNESKVYLPAQLQAKIGHTITQLNAQYRGQFVDEKEFYKGEEPSYETILKFFDVIRRDKLSESCNEILEFINKGKSEIVPVVFLKGSFGTGKSTFAYRLINEFMQNKALKAVAFEVLDHTKIEVNSIVELIKKLDPKYVFIFFNNVEVNSVFISMQEIRFQLSSVQLSEVNIVIVAPIRENVLERFKFNKTITNSCEVNVDSKLSHDEINNLLDKLKRSDLVNFRDTDEKEELVKKIKKSYSSDTFLALMNLIQGGAHENDLYEAYRALPPIAQKAFLYTCLVHQYKIHMPVSLLKSLVAKDWEVFNKEVLKTDCKGILLQVDAKSTGLDPDLYFKTKHPLIAQKVVQKFLGREDERFDMYRKIFSNIIPGEKSSKLSIDLLKSLRLEQVFPVGKINYLYDTCHDSLSDDPHFLLHYAMNLQYRRDVKNLKKAISTLLYAESLLVKRNHRFLHRRGVINFEIAKLLYDEQEDYYKVETYLEEAEALFKLKQVIDQFSSYSYVDYIKMLMWKLGHLTEADLNFVRIQVQIEDLLDLAEKLVTDNLNKVFEVKQEYIQYYGFESRSGYLQYLDEAYEDERIRPYILILKFNYLISDGKEGEAENLIDEIEAYSYIEEVTKFLFKYYGRNLHNINIRIKFYRIAKDYSSLADDNTLRYDYFMFIADSYSRHFKQAERYLRGLKGNYAQINPDFHYTWKESTTGEDEIFEAIVHRTDKGFPLAKIPVLQERFPFVKGQSSQFEQGIRCKVKLLFSFNGIRAEVFDEALV